MKDLLKKLERNQMQAYIRKSREEVIPLLEQLMKQGETVAVGGSMTLFETGVIDYLRSGRFHFLDRYALDLTREEQEKIYRESFYADTYLCSTNALTQNGELYNVDGNGNRVAAMVYGPKSVIVIAGKNKIVPDLEAAVKRVKTIAAPKNCARLACQTYCAQQGSCVSCFVEEGEMTDGCGTQARICCDYVVCGYQRQKGRIKVILVDEELGY